jgi:hypothetical protein
VIELMLQAERALSAGMIDQAERLYWQAVEADRRNSIAVVGLARVALERGDNRLAYTFAQGALSIDPQNDAARRLVERLTEVMAYRGEAIPTEPQGPLVSPFAPPEETVEPHGPPAPEAPAAGAGGWPAPETGSRIRRILGRRR